ncbi:MAG: DUF4870 domain-containing protein [Planctomycetia bacterium]|nr:DUF4870 domain-containing protein [Planctomycetia bacterium]
MATGDYGGQEVGPLKDVDKQMAQMCHMSALIGVVAVGTAMPLGPLLIWLTKRQQSQFVDFHGKEALNFQLTWWLPTLLSMLLGFIDGWFLLLPLLLVVFTGVMAVLAGFKAAEGQVYQYPATIRLVS